jgi:hypothetical protein
MRLPALLLSLLLFCCITPSARAQDDPSSDSSHAYDAEASWPALLVPSPEIDADMFEQMVHGPRPLLVDFFAPWCGHCQNMAPLWEEATERMLTQPTPRTQLVKVNCMEQQTLCARFNIHSFPNIWLMRRETEGGPLRMWKFGEYRTTLAFLVFSSTVWRTMPSDTFPELSQEEVKAIQRRKDRIDAEKMRWEAAQRAAPQPIAPVAEAPPPATPAGVIHPEEVVPDDLESRPLEIPSAPAEVPAVPSDAAPLPVGSVPPTLAAVVAALSNNEPAQPVSADGLSLTTSEPEPEPENPLAEGRSKRLLYIFLFAAVLFGGGGFLLRRHWKSLSNRLSRHHSLQLSKSV